jgi:thiol:disulfide interchange protein DsbD
MSERLLQPADGLRLWGALANGSALALGAMTVNQPQGWPRVGQAAGVLLLSWGVVLVVGAARGAHDPLRPLAGFPTAASPEPVASEASIISVSHLDGLQQALASASTAERPAFVHVTADWCISCKQLERRVYPDPLVAEPLSDFARIDVDVTETHAASRKLLDHYGLFGPPSLLFFHGTEEIREARIQGEVGARALAGHLQGVLDWLEAGRG